MGRKAFTPEQIIFKLREVEVLVAQGESIAIACRKIAVAGVDSLLWTSQRQSKAAPKNINILPLSVVSFQYQPQSHGPSHGTTA